MAPGPSSGVRSKSPPPGLVVAAEEEDSQELERAREKADRHFAEMLHQMEEGQQPVQNVPEVVTVRNDDFWTRFDIFLDTFRLPAQKKEAYSSFVRSFCEVMEIVPEDLLMWGDLDVSSRDLCSRADVPFCERWLDGLDMKDKPFGAEAYETLLKFLTTLLPSTDDSDDSDGELIQLRLSVLLALMSRLQALDLNSKVKKGKNSKGNKKNQY